MQVSPQPPPLTNQQYHAYKNTHSTSTNHTNHKMHVSRQVGKTDFATGSHRDTQTYFYILYLVVNCIFPYNIFVLDVIRLAVNIGQYHSRRMGADTRAWRQTCRHAYMHVHIHARTHKYSCCFFSGCGKRPITHKEAEELSWAQRESN